MCQQLQCVASGKTLVYKGFIYIVLQKDFDTEISIGEWEAECRRTNQNLSNIQLQH